MQRIPDHENALYIDSDTTPVQVMDYVEERLCTPAVIGETVVWNFNNHPLDARALLNADLDPGAYVVPYQVAGVWGFIVDVLPTEIATAPLLTYSADEAEYSVYENLRDARGDYASARAALRDSLSDEDCLDPQTEDIVFGGAEDE
jgi:hypothetical protein